MRFGPGARRRADPGVPGEIDYRLSRRNLIAEYRKGRLAQHEVCDAHPELMRAAREIAEPSAERCPICCQVDLVLVTYVFGPKLPSHGRCITSKAELVALSRRPGEHAAYVVEVCPGCGWNYLARAFLLRPARSA
ncbi:MAG: DUF5318 domain-containing protein [Acidimicrobiales bacterium]|nr:DUF5318 domain-containing protein [Acidimicrobiales bacterium]